MSDLAEYVARLEAGLTARDELEAVETALIDAKTNLAGEELRAAKEALRAMRQAYRENHRPIVMAYEQAMNPGMGVATPGGVP